MGELPKPPLTHSCQCGVVWGERALGWEAGGLSSETWLLCDLGQGTCPLWVLVSPDGTGGGVDVGLKSCDLMVPDLRIEEGGVQARAGQ